MTKNIAFFCWKVSFKTIRLFRPVLIPLLEKVCFCALIDRIFQGFSYIVTGLFFNKLLKNQSEGYLDDKYSVLDIALTLSGYQRANLPEITPSLGKLTSLRLPLKTQEVLEKMNQSGIFNFDFKESFTGNISDLPKASTLLGAGSVGCFQPIKLTFSVDTDKVDFSVEAAKRNNIVNYAWFLGQRTHQTEYFFTQIVLLSKLYFDRETAIAIATYFGKQWPNCSVVETNGRLSYPLDPAEHKKLQNLRSLTEEKTLLKQKNNQERFIEVLFDTEQKTQFPVARYIALGHYAASNYFDNEPFARMQEFIRVALLQWKSDLVEREQLEETRASISANNKIVQAIWIASLNSISGKLTPLKQEREAWRMPQNKTREEILECLIKEVF